MTLLIATAIAFIKKTVAAALIMSKTIAILSDNMSCVYYSKKPEKLSNTREKNQMTCELINKWIKAKASMLLIYFLLCKFQCRYILRCS
jgi:hypothetical protein